MRKLAKLPNKNLAVARIAAADFGQIHLPHLQIRKYFMDDSSINFWPRFFFNFCQIFVKIEEFTDESYDVGSVSETGEFDP